jgi:signal transduction histidine kinase
MFVILINNSVEAARERKVKGAKLKIFIARENDQIIVKFVDNCGGVKEEELSRLFDQFYTTKSEGSGLGLYILKQLAKLMKIKIEVRNNEIERGLEMRLIFESKDFEELLDNHFFLSSNF